ncbi:putative ribonucleoprotein [Ordospora pajunii]|uniref:putative ribonucleoprotein n=1 Tax=Ordospora pajunii TaxID=3039483 RepID=UPI0029528FDC|nr:putative ribonucleoprotein [Ordospora pajunii]KAH9411889.1 putative ribonucleoprotein [Ordospora pajunii]
MNQCRYCGFKRIVALNSKYYCEECEVYYTYRNSKQEYSNFPMEETDQITVRGGLCKKCKVKHESGGCVCCITFREYFRKLPFCRKCKETNEKCIKNAFFRNFILYKAHNRVFSVLHVIIYAFLLYFLQNSILYSIPTLCIVEYRINRSFGALMIARLIFAAAVWHLPYGKLVYCLYCMYLMMFSKKWQYNVPINLDKPPNDLLKHLQHLCIGKSSTETKSQAR